MFVFYVDSDTGDCVIEMTGAAKCISYYGIVDLNEILSAIQLNVQCDLTACRSVKVRHYFQVLQFHSHPVVFIVKSIIDGNGREESSW